MRKNKANKIRKEFGVLNIILLVLLCVYVLSMVIMFGFGLLTSLKTPVDFQTDTLGFPKGHIWEWEWNNYVVTLRDFIVPVRIGSKKLQVGVFRMFLNAIFYALGSSFLNSFMQCTMAYLAAKFKFKMSKVIYGIVVVTMVLPIVGAQPSEIQLLKTIGLYDNLFGVFLLKASFCGMYFLVFYAMFRSFPNDYIEAAQIDGAGNFKAYFMIVLPHAANTILTIVLMTFIGIWNDYQTTLMYMPSNPTIAYGVYYFTQGKGSTETGSSFPPMKMASCMITTLPILILFIFAHKRIMGKIYTGGIKG